jgi:hypothetical protein
MTQAYHGAWLVTCYRPALWLGMVTATARRGGAF